MDRLGFVRSIEAIIAAILAMSVYSFIQVQRSSDLQIQTRTPEILINDFTNVIKDDIKSMVINYDFLKLDYFFNSLFYENVYYYFEPTYYDKFSLSGDYIRYWPNISFIYHFPKGIDKNSVRVTKNNYELMTNAIFNWYQVPVSFSNLIIDEYVQINLSLTQSDINNKTIKFFLRNKESSLGLDYWNQTGFVTNMSLVVYIPEINESEFGYIEFTVGNSSLNISYPSLSKTIDSNYSVFNLQPSRTAEVIFSPENISETEIDYYLKYSLFTDNRYSYNDLTNVNNTGLSYFIIQNYLKDGSTPYTTNKRGGYSVKKIITNNNGFIELIIYGDYV